MQNFILKFTNEEFKHYFIHLLLVYSIFHHGATNHYHYWWWWFYISSFSFSLHCLGSSCFYWDIIQQSSYIPFCSFNWFTSLYNYRNNTSESELFSSIFFCFTFVFWKIIIWIYMGFTTLLQPMIQRLMQPPIATKIFDPTLLLAATIQPSRRAVTLVISRELLLLKFNHQCNWHCLLGELLLQWHHQNTCYHCPGKLLSWCNYLGELLSWYH